MKIVGRNLLKAFCARHADARRWIENWLADTESAIWVRPQDVRARYSSASFLAGNTIIFNVKGNECRLEVGCSYRSGVVIVKLAGTHAACDVRNGKR